MGIVPLCFKAGEDADSLGLTGHERYTIDLPSNISEIRPGQDVTVRTDSGKSFTCVVRFDTEVRLLLPLKLKPDYVSKYICYINNLFFDPNIVDCNHRLSWSTLTTGASFLTSFDS